MIVKEVRKSIVHDDFSIRQKAGGDLPSATSFWGHLVYAVVSTTLCHDIARSPVELDAMAVSWDQRFVSCDEEVVLRVVNLAVSREVRNWLANTYERRSSRCL